MKTDSKFYETQIHSTYDIQKHLGYTPTSGYLYNYIKEPRKFKKMPMEQLQKIAEYEGLSATELFNKIMEYFKEELK